MLLFGAGKMSNKRISAVIANRLRYLITSRSQYGILEPAWRIELISLYLSVERYRESI